MAIPDEEAEPYLRELKRLYSNANYTAVAYYEAAASANRWGRIMAYLPALIAAFAGVMSASGHSRTWGTLSAAAGLMAATATFLGSPREGAEQRNAARHQTRLRHRLRLSLLLAKECRTREELSSLVQRMHDECTKVPEAPAIPNRAFRRATRRIEEEKVLEYDDHED